MTVSAAALRELHRIHIQLGDLRGRLTQGPRQMRTAEQSCERLQQALDEAKEALTRARVAADQKQLQLKEREDRVQDLEAKLNSCSTNREYQALKEQIAADQQANSVLADEILEALEKIDVQQAAVGQRTTELQAAQAEAQKVSQRVGQERQGLEAELARVEAALAEAESELPADVRPEYDRVVKARGEDALAPVEGEYCGGCNKALSPQTMNELYLSKLVFCKSCGCLLYLPEDRSVGA